MSVAFLMRGLMKHSFVKSSVQFSGFLIAGLPSFILAITLNWLLVNRFNCGKAGSYALVLLLQILVNFFMCRQFVFTNRKITPMWMQFIQFLSGILLFRLADWTIYTIAVYVFGFYFLAVQTVNILIFSVLKFKFSQKIMEY